MNTFQENISSVLLPIHVFTCLNCLLGMMHVCAEIFVEPLKCQMELENLSLWNKVLALKQRDCECGLGGKEGSKEKAL